MAAQLRNCRQELLRLYRFQREMVREHARQGGIPANRISEVRLAIDPTSGREMRICATNGKPEPIHFTAIRHRSGWPLRSSRSLLAATLALLSGGFQLAVTLSVYLRLFRPATMSLGVTSIRFERKPLRTRISSRPRW